MVLIFTDDYVELNESNVSKFVLSRIICQDKKSLNLMCDMAVKHLFSWWIENKIVSLLENVSHNHETPNRIW